jgi:uncharacterized Zn finger protein
LKGRCGGQIGSLLELLQGRLSDNVMEVVTHREQGLFPLPGEMSFTCSCPDSARMCKHVAAVLYGVGARLDNKPELLFALRGVDHEELIAADAEKAVTAATSRGKSKRLAASELGEVFGIELTPEAVMPTTESAANNPISASPRKTRTPRKQATRRTTPAEPRRTQATAKAHRNVAAMKDASCPTAVSKTVGKKAKAATAKGTRKSAAASKAKRTKRQSSRPVKGNDVPI